MLKGFLTGVIPNSAPWDSPRKGSGSIQRLTIAFDADGQGDHGKEGDGPNLRGDVLKPVSFEQDATGDPQEMGQRQNFSDGLRPDRHASKRKQISRKQD